MLGYDEKFKQSMIENINDKVAPAKSSVEKGHIF